MTLSQKQRDGIWYALQAAISGQKRFIYTATKEEYKESVACLKDMKKRYCPKGWHQLEDKLFSAYELYRTKSDGMVKIAWDPDRARSRAHKKNHLKRSRKLKERNVLLPWD